MANRNARKITARKPRLTLNGNDYTDIVWNGPVLGDDTDEIINPEVVLREHGFDRESPLEQLLLRLIDASSPTDSKARESRLRSAVAAITGTKKARKPNYEEYHFLLNVAAEYNKRYLENQRNVPELKPIIADLLAEKPLASKFGTIDSQISDLARKFLRRKDLLLVRATTAPDWDPLNRRERLRQIADVLAELGVPIGRGYSSPVSKEK